MLNWTKRVGCVVDFREAVSVCVNVSVAVVIAVWLRIVDFISFVGRRSWRLCQLSAAYAYVFCSIFIFNFKLIAQQRRLHNSAHNCHAKYRVLHFSFRFVKLRCAIFVPLLLRLLLLSPLLDNLAFAFVPLLPLLLLLPNASLPVPKSASK